MEIIRKSVKNFSIRIKSTGIVVITAPLRASDQEINKLIQEKSAWIDKHLTKIQTKIAQHRELLANNMIYLGETYPVILVGITATQREKIIFLNGKCLIYLHDIDDTVKISQLLAKWYLKQAKEILPPILEKYQPLVNKPVNHISIRTMKTRWGSCNTRRGYINLNVDLIKQRLSAIEYVIFHELVHLIHPDHSANFYGFIEQYMQDWKHRQSQLTQYLDC